MDDEDFPFEDDATVDAWFDELLDDDFDDEEDLYY